MKEGGEPGVLWRKSGKLERVARGTALFHREAAKTVSIQLFPSEVVGMFLSTYLSDVIVSHRAQKAPKYKHSVTVCAVMLPIGKRGSEERKSDSDCDWCEMYLFLLSLKCKSI